MNNTDNHPKKSSKKPYIIVGALFIYMCVMAIYNIKTLTEAHDSITYFGTIGIELIILIILFFVLRKRERLKRERLEDLKRAQKEREALERDNTSNAE